MSNPLLEVKNLKTYFHTREGTAKAVDGISFHVEAGKSFGFVGESGCGKTTAALSILKLLPAGGKIESGEIFYRGEDLSKKTDEEIRTRRWKDIAIVFQGAMNSLNPVMKISKQISEAILLHESMTLAQARERVSQLFFQVGLNPKYIDQYPHEFSGGMRQRVMIALALACDPSLIIGDEPTTALDVMVQAQILDLLDQLRETRQLGYILISHDLSVVIDSCERMGVMYAGNMMEIGNSKAIFDHPAHPYTQKLIAAFPVIRGSKVRNKLGKSIAGDPPNPFKTVSGCKFHPRCEWAEPGCSKEDPIPHEVGLDHRVFCWKWDKIG
jgi:peptide/nickel transport system ATP-binding protein